MRFVAEGECGRGLSERVGGVSPTMAYAKGKGLSLPPIPAAIQRVAVYETRTVSLHPYYSVTIPSTSSSGA